MWVDGFSPGTRLSGLHESERLHRQKMESEFQSQKGEKELAASVRAATLHKEHWKAREDVQQLQRISKNKDEKVEVLVNLAQEAVATVTELQDAFVQQTKKFQQLSSSVRRQQGVLLQDMKEAQVGLANKTMEMGMCFFFKSLFIARIPTFVNLDWDALF